MKSIIVLMSILILAFIIPVSSLAQESKPWTLFYDEKTDLYGYMDASRNIMIPPRFIMADAFEFHHIIAVVESLSEGTYQGYYLLKNGKKIGVDSLYMWDNSPDCECEGKIRFREKQSGKVGFFDGRGQVVIPAVYSDAHPFRNNLAMVLKNAKRICPDGTPYAAGKLRCEHWSWKGGRSYLIDIQNKVVIEDFPFTRDLDWFSMTITENKIKSPLRRFFKGKSGKYYSFVSFQKEFRHWFDSGPLLLKDFEDLSIWLFTEVTLWDNDAGEWKSQAKDKFLNDAGKAVARVIKGIRTGELRYELQRNGLGLNPFIFHGKLYSDYFDACRNSIGWKYPVFKLIISYHSEKGAVKYQDILEFLKTTEGEYRLISVSLKGMRDGK